MSQSQYQLPERVTVVATAAVQPNQLIEVGHRVGWANDAAAVGERVAVHLRVRQHGTNLPDGTPQTYADEAWSLGDPIYYNRVTGLVGLDETDTPMGFAFAAKPGSTDQGSVFSDDGRRPPGKLLITLDFDKAEVLPHGAVGDLVLDLGPYSLVSGSLRASGLTSNSGGDLATISVGDSAGSGVEVLAATLVTTLNAGSPNAFNTNIAITGNLIMRIAAEAIDGGKLIIEGTLAAF